ncbi:MAG: type II CAAX prenyl endopeptidase Rce1 family protein [Cyanobium sp.]
MRFLRIRLPPLLRAVLLVLLLGITAPALPARVSGAASAAREGTPQQPLPFSSEALAARSPWSLSRSYPLSQKPRTDLYRPSAEWIGRLILPAPAELASADAPADDWVWIELEQAPADRQAWIGRRLRLRWADQPQLRRLVRLVSTDIRFGADARQAEAAFNVVPTRLNGRRRVGPLQSLAGARPADDMSVQLEAVTPGDDELRIGQPPLQISGRWQGLVTVLGEAGGDDQLRVRHYNRASGRFDGASETIRIPALPPDRFGRRMLEPAGLATSPLNARGWLIQGAPAADGVFTVQALVPHTLLEPRAERELRGTDPALADLRRGTWSQAALLRGSLQSTALVPDGASAPAWAVGDRALLMHLFGGIGGEDGEPVAGFTVTGHFAFGEARVERDPFTGRPALAIRYHQIYANNPNGIVAGSQHWSAYAGSLQRGWLGTRPFADVLVPLGAEALDAIALQTEIMAARYRSGDGAGVALVTASTSCVQDSSQALWIALQQLRQRGDHGAMAPEDRESLQRLGRALDHLLTPFGRVRGDWSANASLALAAGTGRFQAHQDLGDVLLSWRSMLPRGAHDAFAAEFLWAGLPLQLLRTNQIPGTDPRLQPVAPTNLLGQLPVAGTLLGRLGDTLFPPLRLAGPLWSTLILVVYAVLALALARRQGQRLRRPSALAALALLPAVFVTELVIRGLLLPSPLEGVWPLAMVPWIALSVGLFVAWKAWRTRLWGQAALLGLACSLAAAVTGGLWPALLIHWLAASFGGQRPAQNQRRS